MGRNFNTFSLTKQFILHDSLGDMHMKHKHATLE